LLICAAWGAHAGTPPGTAPAPRAQDATGSVTLPAEDARLFNEVLHRVQRDYVTPVNEHKLLEAAIRGMVESLDTHSTFLDGDEYQDVQVTTTGAYAGIGVEVAAAKQGVRVVHRMPGSPAERAGIRSGDLIVSIDGTAVDPTNVDAAIERMRGPDGSMMRLLVQRDGSATPLHFQIRRAEVRLVSVEAERLTPQYGYLRITSFTDSTAQELEKAVRGLEKAAPTPLRGFVIDLRNNPGGVLDAAVQVADDFLDHGTIVSAQGRTADANFRIQAMPGDITHGARLIVLVNGQSASAAEILAAALHDNHRAMLIGRRTYGKGTVQSIMPLEDGAALKLTTSRYFTPSGVSINGTGIVPDVVLKGAEQVPADLDAADDVLERANLAGMGSEPSRVASARAPVNRASDSAALQPTLAQRDAPVGIALNMLIAHAPLLGRAAAGNPVR
jgi:carboxyl-terminal processing protease